MIYGIDVGKIKFPGTQRFWTMGCPFVGQGIKLFSGRHIAGFKKDEISLVRKRFWCISTDREFVPKTVDIIGLYLNSPLNAVVISVGEKPSIEIPRPFTKSFAFSKGSPKYPKFPRLVNNVPEM